MDKALIEKAFQKWHEYEIEKLKQHGSFKDLKEIQLEAYLAQNEIAELKQGQIKGRCKDCKHTEYCEWLASDGYGYCSEFEPKADKVEKGENK